MRHLFTLLFAISAVYIQAQQSFNFESGTVPSQWSGLNGASLSIDSRHYKGGNRALKCELTSGSVIRLNLNTATATNRVAYVPVYSEKISNDTLIFRHFGSSGALTHEGRILLNFKGWRVYHRHLYYDFGAAGWRAYKLLQIHYAPEKPGESRTVWLDDVVADASYSGLYQQRIPGPHDVLDYRAGKFAGDYTDLDYLKAALNTPPAARPATDSEQTSYNKIKQSFTYEESYINSSSLASDAKPYLSKAECDEAKAYVKSLNLNYNDDGSISGTGISFPLDPNTVLTHSFRVLALSYGAQTLQDSEAGALLVDYTRHLIEQGVAEGGPIYLATSSYSVSRQFLLGFLHALPMIREKDQALAIEVENLLRYAYNYNQIFGKFEPGLSTDYIHVKAKYLFALADLRSSTDEKVRDVHAIKTLYENFTYPTDGQLDGMKVDGMGYHHNSRHNAYMYAYSTWVTDMNSLYNTDFQVSEEAYRNVVKFYTSHYLQTANDGNTAYFANASNGRAPFNLTAKVTKSNFSTLVRMGANYNSNIYNDVQATYNYFFSPQASSVKNLNGFHQFNHGAMGIYRNSSWVVNMTGLTYYIWGTEIYDAANVFGRYQSYGALEVMYNGTNVLGRSGYPTATSIPWDWNVVPGTTTVHLDWKSLAPNGSRADEYQTKNFAGSLSAGDAGIFALDFMENPTYYTPKGLRFKKTVFAFDDILLCLGSDISSSHTGSSTATNLFQTILSSSTGNLYVDSETAAGQTYSASLSAGDEHWMVNPAGTGYFIPEGNDAVKVFQGSQTVPNQNNKYNASSYTMSTNQAAKAWIDHEAAPANKKYNFVIVPGTTAASMQQRIPSLRPGAGNYTLVAQQSNAHIVRLDKLKKTGYAIFSQYYNIPEGSISSILNPCLLLTDESENGYLTLHISNPNLQETESSSVVELRGEWELVSSSAEEVFLEAVSEGQTRLTAFLYKGEKMEVRLRDKNSSSIQERQAGDLQVYYNGQDRMLKLQNTGNHVVTSVSLTDISGRELIRWVDPDKNSFPIRQDFQGVYLVTVRLSNGESVIKKIKIF